MDKTLMCHYFKLKNVHRKMPRLGKFSRLSLLAVTFSFSYSLSVQADYIISTVAGIGKSEYSGDFGPARMAEISRPRGIAVDNEGNIYLSDTGNSRVRKVDTSGNISTIAGDGTVGFGGDGGPATAAQFDTPSGLALDSAMDLYIIDSKNNRIRKIDINGNISTVVGNGTAGFGGDGGIAVDAQLNFPSGIAIDGAGNLYIADRENHRVRKVDTNGIITTIAGNGTPGVIDETGTLSAAVEGGTAVSAQLTFPKGVTIDNGGNLYITEMLRIRKVDTAGIITTFAGSGTRGDSGDGGPAVEAQLRAPFDVVVDGEGSVYFSDKNSHRIRKVDVGGIITTIAGNGEQGDGGSSGAASQIQINTPFGITIDSNGDLYFLDRDNNRVRQLLSESKCEGREGQASFSSSDGQLRLPSIDMNLFGGFPIAIDTVLQLQTDSDPMKFKIESVTSIQQGLGIHPCHAVYFFPDADTKGKLYIPFVAVPDLNLSVSVTLNQSPSRDDLFTLKEFHSVK